MSWEQLAAAVRARRTELGLAQVDVAAAGGISVDVVRNIEHRRRTPKQVNPRTARGIELALLWEPGSVATTVAGGKPTPIKSPRIKKSEGEKSSADDTSVPDTHADSPRPSSPTPPPEVSTGPNTGDRFTLARQILALRSALSEHQRAISPEARGALMAEMANSAREAEESIVRIMPWLDEGERGEAIQLLVKLREPLGENITGSS